MGVGETKGAETVGAAATSWGVEVLIGAGIPVGTAGVFVHAESKTRSPRRDLRIRAGQAKAEVPYLRRTTALIGSRELSANSLFGGSQQELQAC